MCTATYKQAFSQVRSSTVTAKYVASKNSNKEQDKKKKK